MLAGGGSAEMNSVLLDTNFDVTVERTKRRLRLEMKSGTATRGNVDGGWWPWSNHPAAEFPALIMALTPRIGPTRHIAYHSDVWAPTEATLNVEGRVVHLEGSHITAAGTVVVTGQDLERVHLLVVPPGTPSGVARAVLRSASCSDTVATAEDILASNGLSLGGQSTVTSRR